ncbi:MAG: hypothetical protein PVJ64_05780 [Gemmatimonadales bacterium]
MNSVNRDGGKERTVVRRLVIPAAQILAGLALLACASSGPAIYWSAFAATEANFQRHFDEAGQDLDPIEGIWSPETWSRGQFAIVRHSGYPDYDYIAVRILQRGVGRGEIVAALRFTELDLPIYEYRCADELRGEPCSTFPCRGTITVAREELWGDPKECFCGFCASYWIKRYPLQ